MPTAPTSAGSRQGPGASRRSALERLLDFYIANGAGGHAFWATIGIDVLRDLIGDLAELAEADALPEDFIDLGEAKAFEVETSEGECAV